MSCASVDAARALPGARLPRPRSALSLLLPLVAVVGVGAAKGGFFATSFGWSSLAFAWVALVGVAFVAPRWRLLDWVWLATAVAMSGYTFASAKWAGSEGDAIQEGLRTLVYLGGVGAALVVLRRRDLERWLTGLVLGSAGLCIYALATRLLPDHFSGFDSNDYRLFEPIGYWNALGIFGVVGLLVAFGTATFGRTGALRLAAGSMLVVFAPTVYFTFSRGAWFALAIGALTALAVSPHRVRLICAVGFFGPIPAAAVLAASRAAGLTDRGSSITQAAHDGHRLALLLVVLWAAQIVAGAIYIGAVSRFEPPAWASKLFAICVTALALATLAAVFVRYGSPFTIARHAYHGFVSTAPGVSNLNGRLFSFSNDGRTVLWHAAWKDFLAHPLTGSGAGSYGAWWLAHRTTAYFVEDAHNLYVQSLAELGIVGSVILFAFLAVPVAAAFRARRNPLVAPALGAYVAFLLHSGYDWDWQVPAVTLLALFVGAALVAAAREKATGDVAEELGGRRRTVVGAAAVVVAAVAFVGLVGNIALSASNSDLVVGNGKKAAADAAKARRWAPWSTDALVDLGEARVLEGRRRAGLAAFRQAAAEDSGNWEIWFDISAVTTGAERRTALAHALRLNPASPEIAQVPRVRVEQLGLGGL